MSEPTRPESADAPRRVGIVVIGRNEGERLHRCIASLDDHCDRIIYVDSDSEDDSVPWALERVASVVELDPQPGLSAARARNAGAERLTELFPTIEYVQFVDGDCEVDADWIDEAVAFLDGHPKAAVVCGRRREISPEATLYNRLADIEWDTPVGRAASCGGDALMRLAVFNEAGGYNPDQIAGEEPELCIRLGMAGHEIYRINAEMTRHDANLTRFSQWWTRNVRSGHASLELLFRHGRDAGPNRARRIRSIVVWSLGPLVLALFFWAVIGRFAGLLPLGLYGLAALKASRGELARGRMRSHAFLYGAACTVGKFPELQGCLRYLRNRLVGRERNALIEYKGAGE